LFVHCNQVNHVSLATLDKYRLKSGYVSVMLNILCVRVCQLNCELRVVINIFNWSIAFYNILLNFAFFTHDERHLLPTIHDTRWTRVELDRYQCFDKEVINSYPAVHTTCLYLIMINALSAFHEWLGILYFAIWLMLLRDVCSDAVPMRRMTRTAKLIDVALDIFRNFTGRTWGVL
jgi:hypothetical protein